MQHREPLPPVVSEPKGDTYEEYDGYTQVQALGDVFGPGDRIYRRLGTSVPRPPPPTVLAGKARLKVTPRVAPLELRLIKIERALVYPRQLIVNLRTGKPIFDSLRKPPPLGSLRDAPAPIEVDREHRVLRERIDRLVKARKPKRLANAFHAAGKHMGYGHVLLESMSRLWGFEEVSPFVECIIAPETTTGFARPLLAPFGATIRNTEILGDQPFHCDNLIVPSQAFLLNTTIAAEVWPIYERIRGFYAPNPRTGRRLYVSRRFAEQRRMLGEDEIEAVFSSRGFEVIHPERMTVEAQVALFASAEWVAGPVGSGLYNAVFSNPGVRMIVLGSGNFHSRIESLISRGVAVHYIFGSPSTQDRREAMTMDWRMDPQIVRRAIASLDFG